MLKSKIQYSNYSVWPIATDAGNQMNQNTSSKLIHAGGLGKKKEQKNLIPYWLVERLTDYRGTKQRTRLKFMSCFLTSSSPLAAKARHDLSNLGKVHSASHIDTERTSVDVAISHSNRDLMVSSYYWLIRHGVSSVFIVYDRNWDERERLSLKSAKESACAIKQEN